jgi:hypothetical protein
MNQFSRTDWFKASVWAVLLLAIIWFWVIVFSVIEEAMR